MSIPSYHPDGALEFTLDHAGRRLFVNRASGFENSESQSIGVALDRLSSETADLAKIVRATATSRPEVLLRALRRRARQFATNLGLTGFLQNTVGRLTEGSNIMIEGYQGFPLEFCPWYGPEHVRGDEAPLIGEKLNIVRYVRRKKESKNHSFDAELRRFLRGSRAIQSPSLFRFEDVTDDKEAEVVLQTESAVAILAHGRLKGDLVHLVLGNGSLFPDAFPSTCARVVILCACNTAGSGQSECWGATFGSDSRHGQVACENGATHVLAGWFSVPCGPAVCFVHDVLTYRPDQRHETDHSVMNPLLAVIRTRNEWRNRELEGDNALCLAAMTQYWDGGETDLHVDPRIFTDQPS